VIDDFNYLARGDQQPILQQRGRSGLGVLKTVVVLTVIATAGAYLWVSYGDLVQPASGAAQPAAAPMVADGEEPATEKDFEALKRQVGKSLQTMLEDIDAQKADLKKLSDQVAALSAKIDALQNAATPAPLPVAPARPPVVTTRKKNPTPKTPGPISIGGAPLQSAPSDNQ
jgi:hypothetical protein